jgi:predicted GIY-YIG superfamily endonuclease
MTSNLSLRLYEHEQGLDHTAYTFGRRPTVLVWCQDFSTHDEASNAERRIKGWSRAKKEALIRGDLDEVHRIVRKEWEEELAGRERGGPA